MNAAAVVADLDDDVPAFVIGVQDHRSHLGLARGAARLARLDAVVGRVADHVGERVLDELEHLAVELGVRADHLEVDLLTEVEREVADDARQLRPGVADGLHARLHDAFLKLGGDVAQAVERHRELVVGLSAHHLQELIAGEHQFAHHGHQVFEQIDADADVLIGDLRFGGAFDGGGSGVACGGNIRRRVCRHARDRHRDPIVEVGGYRIGGRFRRARVHVIRVPVLGDRADTLDKVVVVALGFLLVAFQRGENPLDAIERLEDHGHRLGGDGKHAVAVLAEYVLGHMRDRLQAWQSEKTARPLDRVDDPENLTQETRVIGIFLESDQSDIENREALVCLGEKFVQQLVHEHPPAATISGPTAIVCGRFAGC